MNDDFLSLRREPPRRAFSDALYTRIAQARRSQVAPFQLIVRKRLGLALAILTLVLGALFALSPDVRAQVGQVLKRIGPFSFKETDQYPEPNWDTIYLQGQNVSLEQAKQMAPYPLKTPGWVPSGFVMDKDVLIHKDEDVGGTRIFVRGVPVTITWRRDKGFPIALTQELASGPVGPGPVGPGSVQEVKVNGEPAALVRGVWNDNSKTWSVHDQTLLWRRNGVDYRLSAPLDISMSDLVRMAESLK